MSNTATFALGAGSGLALWYLTKPERRNLTSDAHAAPATSPAPRNCAVHVDASGLFVDGARTTLDDAIRSCTTAGRAQLTIAKNAPASTCAELAAALASANVPAVRNAGSTERSSTFTLVDFPDGIWGKRRARYFHADPPTTWTDAHARLLAANILDTASRARWELYSDPIRYRADNAAPLPAAQRNADGYTMFTLRYYPDGRAGNAKQRWFLADAPVPWTVARDRLVGAGIVDASVAGRTFEPGGWMLSVDRSQFHAPLAEPLPSSPRNSAELFSTFTLAVYPEGQWGATKRVQWFRANPPTTWDDARDRLAAAGVIDPRIVARGPNYPGAWILVTDPRSFDHAKAVALPTGPRLRQRLLGPSGARNAKTAAWFSLTVYPEGAYGIKGEPSTLRLFHATVPTTYEDARDRLAAAGLIDPSIRTHYSPGFWILGMGANAAPHDGQTAEPLPEPLHRRRSRKGQTRYTTDGRRIVRDGEPMVLVERVDLGDESYVLSPAHTDQLVKRIVYLLNRYGMR